MTSLPRPGSSRSSPPKPRTTSSPSPALRTSPFSLPSRVSAPTPPWRSTNEPARSYGAPVPAPPCALRTLLPDPVASSILSRVEVRMFSLDEVNAFVLMPPSPSVQWSPVDPESPMKSSSEDPALRLRMNPVGPVASWKSPGRMIETWVSPSLAAGVDGSSELSTTWIESVLPTVGLPPLQPSTGPPPRTWMSPLGPTARTVWSPSVSMPTDRTWNVGSKLQVVAALAAGAMPSAPASTAVAVAMRAPVRMPRSLRLRGHAHCQELDARRVELLGREHAPDAVAEPEPLGRGHGQVPVAAADVGAAVHDGNADSPVAVAEGDLRAARHGL